MKTLKTILAKTMCFSIIVLTALSCSTDEDEMEVPEVAEDIRFRVELTKIKVTDTSGEGDANNDMLEIFGELSTYLTIGTTVDTKVLWSADVADAISVGQNDTQLTGETTFTVTVEELANSSITCAGDLEENDGGGFVQDEGEESSTFSLAAIKTSQDIELTFSKTPGQTSVVTFIITRI